MRFEFDTTRRPSRSGLPLLLAGLPILLLAGQHFHLTDLFVGNRKPIESALAGGGPVYGNVVSASVSPRRESNHSTTASLFGEDDATRRQRLEALLATTVSVRNALPERLTPPVVGGENAPIFAGSSRSVPQMPTPNRAQAVPETSRLSGLAAPRVSGAGIAPVRAVTSSQPVVSIASSRYASGAAADLDAISTTSFLIASPPAGGFFHSRRKSRANDTEANSDDSNTSGHDSSLASLAGSADDTGVFGGSRPRGGITRAETDYVWTGAAGDTRWSSAANWAGNTVPLGSSAVAVFNGNGSAQSLNDILGYENSGYPIAGLVFSSDTTSYTLSGAAFGFQRAAGNPFITQNGSAPVTISNALRWTGQALQLGGDGTGLVTLTGWKNGRNGGGNTPADLYKTGQSTYELHYYFPASLDDGITGNLHVNGGTLRFTEGTVLSDVDGYIGENASDQGVLTLSNGIPSHGMPTWKSSGTAYVGYMGNGTLNLINSTQVTAPNLYAGVGAASSGTIQVGGTGATMEIDSTTIIGQGGSGSLSLTSGGKAYVGNLSIASGVGSSGTVTVDGTGVLTAEQIQVGIRGNAATLNLSNGGVVFGGSDIFLGNSAQPAAAVYTINVDGTGSKLNGGNLFVGGIGSGQLNVTNGASVINSILYCGGSLPGTLGTLGTRGAGVIDASGGSLLQFNGSAYTGENIGSTAKITASGAGTQLKFLGGVSLGHGGMATLNILDGASAGSATTGMGGSGDIRATHALVNVDGAGSTFNTSTLKMYFGTALNVTNGGSVISSSVQLSGSSLGVIYGPSINVSGAGSLFQSSGSAFELGQQLGAAQLNITNGGAAKVLGLYAFGSRVSSGTSLPSSILVDGAGSTLTSQSVLTIGSYNSPGDYAGASLTITNGASVTAPAQTDLAGLSNLTVSSGTLTTSRLTGEGTIQLSGNFTLNQSSVSTFGGKLVDGGTTTGVFTKAGAGTLTLTGASTFSGGTAITAGTIVANGTALGLGGVQISGGATLSVGERVNPSPSFNAMRPLSISSLALTAGSAVPQLTFNLGANGVSDVLKLTGAGTELTFSGAGDINIGFASGTGLPLGDGTYTLMTFATPEALGSAPTLSQFHAVAAGNLSSLNPGYAFAYQLTNGNITALTFTLSSADTPEPDAAMLMLSALPIAGIAFRCGGCRKRRA